MAEKVVQFEDLRVTFNFMLSLIRQSNDIVEGAKDLNRLLREKPVVSMTELEKRFMLEWFFDVNWKNIIAKYPRFQQLLDKRRGTDQEALSKRWRCSPIQLLVPRPHLKGSLNEQKHKN